MSDADSERAMAAASLAIEIAKAIGHSKVPFAWGTLNDRTQNECIEAARHVLKALTAHPDAVLAALGYIPWGAWLEDDEPRHECNHGDYEPCMKAHHQRQFTIWRHRIRPDVQTRDRSADV